MKRILLVGVLLLTLGCSLGRNNPQYSFILQPSPPSPCSHRLTLTMPTLKADEPYDTSLMAYSPSPLEVEFYAYHRWAGPLPKLVTQAIRESLEGRKCVNLVPFTHGIPVLQGRIVRFIHTIHGGESWGEAVIQFTLLQGDRVLGQKTFQARVQARENTPRAGVEALNKALEKIIEDLTEWLEREVPRITGEG